MSALGLFIQQASRLYRLVDQVDVVVRESLAVRTHSKESVSFLAFVGDAVRATQAFLKDLQIEWINESPERREHFEGKIAELSGAWALLHNFIKPVADAHTLCIPTPLVRLVGDCASRIVRPGPALLAVELVTPLNYIEVGQTGLQEINGLLRAVLGPRNAPRIPDGLGIVGLPYSQGSSLFLNCLLFHELGHYIFEQHKFGNLDVKDHLFEKVGPVLKNHFQSLIRTPMIRGSRRSMVLSDRGGRKFFVTCLQFACLVLCTRVY